MKTQRSISVLIITLAGLVAANDANAQFGALQRVLFRATEYSGDRDFLSNPQGGPLFDNNLFEQRIEQNRGGDGWAYDSFRFFGPDSFDNPNTLDLGAFKVQLGRDPTILGATQPVGVHNRIGFTTRVIPEVSFRTRTGQRAFDIFSGQTNFATAPLNYNVIMDTGVQNFNFNGNLLIDSDGKINALGFYDVNMRLTNVGSATAEGVILQNEEITDFDTGPLHLTGNIVFDAIAGIFQSTGNSLLAAPASIISAAPPKDKRTDELMARINNGEKLSDADMSFLVQQMLVTAFMNDPLGFLQNGMPETVAGFEGLSLRSYEAPPPGVDPGYIDAAVAAGVTDSSGVSSLGDPVSGTVPEPGTLVLLAAAAASMRVLREAERRLR